MGDQVTIVGVSGRDTVAAMLQFVDRHGVDTIDHVADVDGEVWDINGIGGQPAWVFVDGTSGEAATKFGALGEEGLRAGISEHLGVQPG